MNAGEFVPCKGNKEKDTVFGRLGCRMGENSVPGDPDLRQDDGRFPSGIQKSFRNFSGQSNDCHPVLVSGSQGIAL